MCDVGVWCVVCGVWCVVWCGCVVWACDVGVWRGCVAWVCDVGMWCVSGDENKELGDPFTLEDVFKLTPRKFSAHWLPGITTSCRRHQH